MLETTFRGEHGDGDRISPGVDGCSRGSGKRCVEWSMKMDFFFLSCLFNLTENSRCALS